MADAADVTEVSAIVLTTICHHTELRAKREGTLYITSFLYFMLLKFIVIHYVITFSISPLVMNTILVTSSISLSSSLINIPIAS
jgi:hypothetical protein